MPDAPNAPGAPPPNAPADAALWKQIVLALRDAVLAVVLKTLAWGVCGAAAGVAAFGALYLIVPEYLAFAAEPLGEFSGPGFALLALLYAAAGALVFGYAGLARGIARALFKHGLDDGARVAALAEAMLDRAAALLKLAPGAEALRNVPLDRIEAVLKEAAQAMLGERPGATGAGALMRRFLRRTHRSVIARIESATLAEARAQRDESGGGGVDFAKLRGVAAQRASESVRSALGRALAFKTALAAGLFVLAAGLLPLAFHAAGRTIAFLLSLVL